MVRLVAGAASGVNDQLSQGLTSATGSASQALEVCRAGVEGGVARCRRAHVGGWPCVAVQACVLYSPAGNWRVYGAQGAVCGTTGARMVGRGGYVSRCRRKGWPSKAGMGPVIRGAGVCVEKVDSGGTWKSRTM